MHMVRVFIYIPSVCARVAKDRASRLDKAFTAYICGPNSHDLDQKLGFFVVRKPDCCMQTRNVQISLRICAV